MIFGDEGLNAAMGTSYENVYRATYFSNSESVMNFHFWWWIGT